MGRAIPAPESLALPFCVLKTCHRKLGPRRGNNRKVYHTFGYSIYVPSNHVGPWIPITNSEPVQLRRQNASTSMKVIVFGPYGGLHCGDERVQYENLDPATMNFETVRFFIAISENHIIGVVKPSKEIR